MKIVYWCLLISSAILYAMPFIFSEYAWWLVFIFPVPLFYVALHEKMRFIHGYVWGAITLALHLSGVIYGIFTMSQGSLALRVLPGIFIVAYEALYAGAWFLFATAIREQLKLPLLSVSNLSLWVAGLWAYVYFMDYYCLCLFDYVEGYFFMHPIIPLTEQTILLRALPTVGKQIISLSMYSVSACITALLVWPTILSSIALLISFIPWLAFWFTPHKTDESPAWLSRIAPFQVTYPEFHDTEQLAYAVREDINKLLFYYKDADIIIYPESSFYECNLFKDKGIKQWWGAEYFGKPIHILAGSFLKEDNKFYNCLYWTHDGQIEEKFSKRHAMLLVERTPALFDSKQIHSLYHSKIPPITTSDNERPCFCISPEIALVPYICSELFFQEYPDDTYPNKPILSVSNDRWCPVSYVRRLMYLMAKYRSIAWQRPVLFVSFDYASWMSPLGGEIHL